MRAVVRGVRRRVYPSFLSGAKETEQLMAPELLLSCHALSEEFDAPEWDEAADEDAEEEDAAPEEDEAAPGEEEGPITEEEKRLADKVHVNLGHPERSRLLRVLRAAGVKSRVLRWLRDEYVCPHCVSKGKQRERRRAAILRTFAFNRVVSVDTFKVEFLGTHYVLNIVDHGSNLQICALL